MPGRLRRIAIDVTPLRVSRDFRLLWTGSFISALGSQFVRVGLYVQVYALTGSAAQVGLLGVSALAGNVIGTFVEAGRPVVALAVVDHADLRLGRGQPQRERRPATGQGWYGAEHDQSADPLRVGEGVPGGPDAAA